MALNLRVEENSLNQTIPEILLTGHHENIRKWRREESIKNTYLKRPNLLEKLDLSKEDKEYVEKLKNKKEEIQDGYY